MGHKVTITKNQKQVLDEVGHILDESEMPCLILFFKKSGQEVVLSGPGNLVDEFEDMFIDENNREGNIGFEDDAR